MPARASIPAVSPARFAWFRLRMVCAQAKRITYGGRSHPLRHLGPRRPARGRAQGAHGHRRERSSREHHFYISFDTRADGVRLSPRMLAQYPKEMTIVLQHQFWDLVMTENGFEVGLSFGGTAERLSVPFAAIKGFFDPSVQFGLQFEEIGET